ncbi:MAG: FAD-binding oxidoreductase [Solirubrobacteraceae bacterium]
MRNVVSASGLRRDLSRVVGVECVVEDGAGGRYDHDATIQRGLRGRADAVVCPRDAAAVSAVVDYCYAHGLPMVPRGGGTGLAGGATPVQGGVVVSAERMREIRSFEPGLWRMTVGAGLSTAHVARLARENGLLFPPDPGAAEVSQIGGNVATNAGGPHAFKYGRTGAFVTGLEAVLAPGELVSLGGASRRDAAGYDLIGLLVGSEGTLGFVTAVELSLVPAPEGHAGVVTLLPDLESAQQALLNILAGGLRPAVLDFLDSRVFAASALDMPAEVFEQARARGIEEWFPSGRAGSAQSPHAGAPWGAKGVSSRAAGAADDAAAGLMPARAPFALLLELEGCDEALNAQMQALEEALVGSDAVHMYARPERLWRWRDGIGPAMSALRGGRVAEDIRVAPELLAQALEGVYGIGRELDLVACAWGHAGDGVLHASFLVDLDDESERERARIAGERSLALALGLGGSITGEHGVGWVKRGAFGAAWDDVALAAHGNIKQALDPLGLLNPGKKVPLAGPPANRSTSRDV